MTAHASVVKRLSQTTDTPALEVAGRRFQCLLGSWRSADSVEAENSVNEDALVLQHDDERCAFAVCDGVSQSFMAHIGAAHLAGKLVEYLWGLGPDVQNCEQQLADVLCTEASTVSAILDAVLLSAGLSPIVREALDDQRDAGSETTFAAALVDMRSRQVVLTWMGDTRLRLWRSREEDTETLGSRFDVRERWSSRRDSCLVGRAQPHFARVPLPKVCRVAAYTDGLSVLDGALSAPLTASKLRDAFATSRAAASSDDASLVQVIVR